MNSMPDNEPLSFVIRAIKALQASNLTALTEGEGRGHTTRQMAEVLDRELGFSEMYAELQRLQAADRIFRQLLFAAHGFGYGDDGEMQGTNKRPIIDFKRDAAEEIQDKIQARNLLALAKARGETDGG